jgi:uncharacterized protein YraI
MESVATAARNISRKLYAACANKVKRWSLSFLRNLIWRADEWVHAQEQKLRADASRAEYAAEVDPVVSAVRERAIVKARKPRRRGMSAAQFDARFLDWPQGPVRQ